MLAVERWVCFDADLKVIEATGEDLKTFRKSPHWPDIQARMKAYADRREKILAAPDCSCKLCGTLLRAKDFPRIQPNFAAVCNTCGNIYVVDHDYSFRDPTDDELRTLMHAPWGQDIRDHQASIRISYVKGDSSEESPDLRRKSR